jgi:hypothetical protein
MKNKLSGPILRYPSIFLQSEKERSDNISTTVPGAEFSNTVPSDHEVGKLTTVP